MKTLDHTTRQAPALEALALLDAGDLNGAHRLVQDDPSPEAAWVHAHLHRTEGDIWNARYWYARTGRPESTRNLEDERREIMHVLGSSSSY